MNKRPSSPQEEFVSRMLREVSRSFALVIPALETPLDRVVGVAYLVCRVCDNIEDCLQPLSWKQERWEEFEQLLQKPSQPSEVLRIWSSLPWPGLTASEVSLMGPESRMLWDIIADLPDDSVASIRHWAMEMAHGMERMLSEQSPIVRRQGVSVLRDLQTFDEYCYYVAGTVGQMCTQLTAQHYRWESSITAQLHNRANAFGRALQKTNILKDFAKDLSRGVCYFPATWMSDVNESPLRNQGAETAWSAQVIAHILQELAVAVDYIATLPLWASGYRRFCLRAVLPAYETMNGAALRLEQLFTHDHEIKIDRVVMMQCMADTEQMVENNEPLFAARSRYEGNLADLFRKAGAMRDLSDAGPSVAPFSTRSNLAQTTTHH